jgi:hypothetical protein
MNLPFTLEQFLSVFKNYNLSVQPVQIILNFAALVILFLIYTKYSDKSRIINILLFLIWTWTGLVYHIIFFSGINPAAKVFGAIFIIQGLLFLIFGSFSKKLGYKKVSMRWQSIIGSVLIIYSLAIYPLLGMIFGHAYPSSPTFGLPCPTTIFTIGLFFLAYPEIPFYMLIIPLIWSIIGGSAAFKLGIYEDYGLIISGLLSISLFFKSKKNC